MKKQSDNVKKQKHHSLERLVVTEEDGASAEFN